jgi:molybdopterin/thiamine biosynthesis adenylyltransferase|tara:strand:- start:92 stop:751 length:660 start_codon:yes stop_codon:yes gene_type:complete
MNSRTSRFHDIIPQINTHHFHILGCGAIGSSAAIQIARTGAERFSLYDPDEVSIENIGVSQYDKSHLSMLKVDALEKILKNICDDVGVFKYPKLFEVYDPSEKDVVILGFDSMKSRMDAIQTILLHKKQPILVIDGRMGSESYQQYSFKNKEISEKNYRKCWYSDIDASSEPCTRKATSYCSNMAGSFITNTIGRALNKMEYAKEIVFHFPSMSLMTKE